MSTSTVIGDVTQTLEDLLTTAQQPPNSFTVSLRSPAEETLEGATRPIVNLFLFRVAENPFAKNQDWLPVGTGALHYPPLALNLFYVLTPFAQNRLDEHRVLGEAMHIFYDHSIITAPLLRGGLENSTEELKVDLCQLNLEDLTRIWNALNQPYRLSVCYDVRVVLIDSTIERPIQRVLDKEERYGLYSGR
jgi:hypothetical protein